MKTQTTIRVDETDYHRAKKILNQIGLNYSQAISVFNSMIVLNNGLPFEVKVPTKRLKKALNELKLHKGKSFNNVDDLFNDLNRWIHWMYEIFRTAGFKKHYKKLLKNNENDLREVITKLSTGKKLEKKYKDHKLTGNYHKCRECHIKPDLLLIYRINDDTSELSLVEIGKHSELFAK